MTASGDSLNPENARPTGSRLDDLLASNRRPAFRTLAWLIMALIAGFFAWASVAQLDEVSSAAGETGQLAESQQTVLAELSERNRKLKGEIDQFLGNVRAL